MGMYVYVEMWVYECLNAESETAAEYVCVYVCMYVFICGDVGVRMLECRK